MVTAAELLYSEDVSADNLVEYMIDSKNKKEAIIKDISATIQQKNKTKKN